MRRLDAIYDLPERRYGDVVGRRLGRIEQMIARQAPRPTGPRRSSGAFQGVRARLPAGVGDGVWDFFHLSDDCYLSLTDASYSEPTEVRLPFEEVVKIRVLMDGQLRLSFSDAEETIGPGLCVSLHPGAYDNSYRIERGWRQRMVVLHYGRKLFEDLVEKFACAAARDMLAGLRPFTAQLTPSLRRDAEQLFEPPCAGPLGALYREAKATELLCSALQGMSGDIHPRQAPPRRADRNRIEEARAILVANLDNPPLIADLARAVGMSRTKLQSLFREIVGMAIFEYVRFERMRQAQALLCDTDLSVTEIAYRLGYGHPGNFATAFRGCFGQSPRAYARRRLS